MSDYVVTPLDGVLTRASSAGQVLETTVPLVEKLLAETPYLVPHLFFIVHDGQDGVLKLAPKAAEQLDKNQQAFRFRRFCAVQGVKACAFLASGRARRPEASGSDMQRPQGHGADDIVPVGASVVCLFVEIFGEAERLCIWNLDSADRVVRVENGWNQELESTGGRFMNFLGQGPKLGYPVDDGFRDLFLATSQGKIHSTSKVRSISKGRTPGEIICETAVERIWARLVESDGLILIIGLLTGDVLGKINKATFLKEVSHGTK